MLDSDIEHQTNPIMQESTYFKSVASLTAGIQAKFFRDVLMGRIDIDYSDAIDLFLTEYYSYLIKDRTLMQTYLRESRKLAETLTIDVKPDFSIHIDTKEDSLSL